MKITRATRSRSLRHWNGNRTRKSEEVNRMRSAMFVDTAKRLTVSLTATMAALVLSCGIASAQSVSPQPTSSKQSDAKADDYERWDSVREVYFPGRAVEDGSDFLS